MLSFLLEHDVTFLEWIDEAAAIFSSCFIVFTVYIGVYESSIVTVTVLQSDVNYKVKFKQMYFIILRNESFSITIVGLCIVCGTYTHTRKPSSQPVR